MNDIGMKWWRFLWWCLMARGWAVVVLARVVIADIVVVLLLIIVVFNAGRKVRDGLDRFRHGGVERYSWR